MVFNLERNVTKKIYKQDLCSHTACHLMMYYVCIKFHGNIMNAFQLEEWAYFFIETTTYARTVVKGTYSIYKSYLYST